MDRLTSSGKSFDIAKRLVMEAWEKVRANRGAPGVDEVALGEFEKDLAGSLYGLFDTASGQRPSQQAAHRAHPVRLR